MKIQFSLFKFFVFLTAFAVCLPVVAEIGPRPLLSIPMLAVVGIGTIAAAVVTIHLLLLTVACLRRFTRGGNADTASQRRPFSQANSTSRQIDTVVAAAETIVPNETDSSIVFLSPTVDDSDVARLCELSELKWLVLDNTDVTDAGLVLLSSLTKLRRLYVRGTRVTSEGIQRLQQLLPGVEILH